MQRNHIHSPIFQSHSEVPEKDEDWPALDEILEFRDRVWERTRALYADIESGKRQLTRKVARVLFMVFEHQAYHTEVCVRSFASLRAPS